jgi:NAD(P)-dependent dehydrogenase (short-subunit alcohol dehydrogenase family)
LTRTAGTPEQDQGMTETTRIALVTGANKGIGWHVARQLGEAGVTVLVGSRDPERGRAAVDQFTEQGLAVQLVVLDVTDADSVAAAAEQVTDEHGRLDILVNNAGIGSGTTKPSELPLADLRRVYETNVFGVVTVTNAFVPLLRRSTAPRIVNVSSGLGSLTMMAASDQRWAALNVPAYQSSKAALNALTLLYSRELAPDGFRVNVVNPGYRATELGGANATDPRAGDPAEGAAAVVALALIGDDGPTGQFHTDTGGTLPW